MKITDAEGKEIEVLTLEEVEAQKTAAVEASRATLMEESKKVQETLKSKEEELAKLKDKEMNFEALRKSVDEKLGAMKKEVLDGVLQDHYNDNLGVLAGADEELKKKIELQYKRLTDVAATKEQVARKLRDAWSLATKIEDTNALNSSVISSGSVVRPRFAGQNQQFSQEEKIIGNKLGLSEEDFKKYGK